MLLFPSLLILHFSIFPLLPVFLLAVYYFFSLLIRYLTFSFNVLSLVSVLTSLLFLALSSSMRFSVCKILLLWLASIYIFFNFINSIFLDSLNFWLSSLNWTNCSFLDFLISLVSHYSNFIAKPVYADFIIYRVFAFLRACKFWRSGGWRVREGLFCMHKIYLVTGGSCPIYLQAEAHVYRVWGYWGWSYLFYRAGLGIFDGHWEVQRWWNKSECNFCLHLGSDTKLSKNL